MRPDESTGSQRLRCRKQMSQPHISPHMPWTLISQTLQETAVILVWSQQVRLRMKTHVQVVLASSRMVSSIDCAWTPPGQDKQDMAVEHLVVPIQCRNSILLS